jgi:hypothetical protein
MPRVQRVDGSDGHSAEVRWIAPPSLPVCKPAQILDRGTDRPWPFLYTYGKDGSVSVNRGAKKTHYEEALAVGEAQF